MLLIKAPCMKIEETESEFEPRMTYSYMQQAICLLLAYDSSEGTTGRVCLSSASTADSSSSDSRSLATSTFALD
ncbi:hypothetical protein ACB092_07G026000 [Castanea dentata]